MKLWQFFLSTVITKFNSTCFCITIYLFWWFLSWHCSKELRVVYVGLSSSMLCLSTPWEAEEAKREPRVGTGERWAGRWRAVGGGTEAGGQVAISKRRRGGGRRRQRAPNRFGAPKSLPNDLVPLNWGCFGLEWFGPRWFWLGPDHPKSDPNRFLPACTPLPITLTFTSEVVLPRKKHDCILSVLSQS